MNHAALLVVLLAFLLITNALTWLLYARSLSGCIASLLAVWACTKVHRWAWP